MYNISVLSNIPLAVTSLVQSDSPPHRLKPLFCIGVHDIPLLEEDHKIALAQNITTSINDVEPSEGLGHGWVACTTDGIIGMKKDLYDILITLPISTSDSPWPTVTSSFSEEPLRATQRDLRRYKVLEWGLDRSIPSSTSPNPTLTRQNTSSSSASLINHSRRRSTPQDPLLNIPDTDAVIEPLSWSALAYSGFMWWASAGERHITMDDEFSSDHALLDDLVSTPAHETPRSRASSRAFASGVLGGTEGQAKKETAIIAYFHRLTALIMTTLSDIVDATDSDDERNRDSSQDTDEGEDSSAIYPTVRISCSEMDKMGLDSWSLSDHAFVQDMCKAYFGRDAAIERNAVDVCGIRIC